MRLAWQYWGQGTGDKATLGNEILRYIAGTIQSNIRELEGALNKILAYHQFKNTAPSLESVQTLLQSYIPSIPKRTITPRRLMEIVTTYYDITVDEVLVKAANNALLSEANSNVSPSQRSEMLVPAIGDHLGGRDHTTAMHACSK